MSAEKKKSPNTAYKYQRVLLKMSGEVLMGEKEFGLDSFYRQAGGRRYQGSGRSPACRFAWSSGAGNIFRGVSGSAEGMDRTTADYMGMLGIVINALALQNALEHLKR
jgi:uridylate kinase